MYEGLRIAARFAGPWGGLLSASSGAPRADCELSDALVEIRAATADESDTADRKSRRVGFGPETSPSACTGLATRSSRRSSWRFGPSSSNWCRHAGLRSAHVGLFSGICMCLPPSTFGMDARAGWLYWICPKCGAWYDLEHY